MIFILECSNGLPDKNSRCPHLSVSSGEDSIDILVWDESERSGNQFSWTQKVLGSPKLEDLEIHVLASRHQRQLKEHCGVPSSLKMSNPHDTAGPPGETEATKALMKSEFWTHNNVAKRNNVYYSKSCLIIKLQKEIFITAYTSLQNAQLFNIT